MGKGDAVTKGDGRPPWLRKSERGSLERDADKQGQIGFEDCIRAKKCFLYPKRNGKILKDFEQGSSLILFVY